MKSPLWMLLVLSLFVPGHGDCQGDCLACLDLLPKEQAFNTLVCLMECHDNASPGFNWEMCRNVMETPQLPGHSAEGALLKRSDEDVPAPLPLQQGQDGLLLSEALQRFDHVARALGLSRQDLEGQSAHLIPEAVEQKQAEEDEGEEMESVGDGGQQDLGEAINLTKRFGGFLKGKYGYKKLVNPGRSFQKRYGGFIGVRKSARKWNNQKRFTEFLKQYLGMSTRSTEYNSVSTGLAQQNEV